MKDLNNIKWALKSSHPEFKKWVQENRIIKAHSFQDIEYYHFPSVEGFNGYLTIQEGYELITEQEFLEWRKHEDTVAQYSGTVQVEESQSKEFKQFITEAKEVLKKAKLMEKQITLIPFKHEVWEADNTRKVYMITSEVLNVLRKLPDNTYAAWWQVNGDTFLDKFNSEHMYFAQEDEPEMWVNVVDGLTALNCDEKIYPSKQKAIEDIYDPYLYVGTFKLVRE